MKIRFFAQICLLIMLSGSFMTLTAQEPQSPAVQSYPKIKTSTDKPMYMISYDHGGIILWGKDHFIKYLATARDWLDKYPGFKIGLDNEAYFYDYLNESDTALLQKIKSLLKIYPGRFGIGTCTYGQPLSQFINEESNIRQIGYALETEKEIFKVTPTVYLMSEHAMHSQIPQILNGFGFQGAVMRTHYMNFGYNPTYDSPIGWWTGMDGSRIPAIPTYKGEGNEFGSDTEDNNILCCYPSESCHEPLEAFREKFSGIDPLIATRADDSGLRHEELVKEYEGNKKFKWILAEEIFHLFPGPVDVYKTLPDDFHVRMPWGYCGNEIWNRSRKAEVNVLTAERIAALELMKNGKNHEAALKSSWKNLLVGQHHDIQICGVVKDARRFLGASDSISESVISSSMHFFASRMKGGSLSQITIFNPLSVVRKEWLTVPLTLPGEIRSIELKIGEKNVPFETIRSEYDRNSKLTHFELIILVEIPPLGIQSISVNKGRQKPEPAGIQFNRDSMIISTPFWKIRLDSTGCLSGIENRESGRQMLNKQRNAFFAGVINGQEIESSGNWKTDEMILSGNLLVMHSGGKIGSIPYDLEMKLTSYSPLIDFNVNFTFNDEKIGKAASGRNENEPEFFHEAKLRFKLFPALGIGTTGIRDLPFTRGQTDYKYIEGNYWTCLADGHAGLAILNRGEMAAVREADGSLSVPLAFSSFKVLIPVTLNGKYSYNFALYPFDGKWEDANIHARALDYNFPLVAIQSEHGSNEFGNMVTLFGISSDNVILSALYTEKGIPYIRFYEYNGKEGALDLQWINMAKAIPEVDLLGKDIGNSSRNIAFSPWKIRTFRITKQIR
jgi:alpha-mannosidase